MFDRKSSKNEGIDRISSLPSDILCIILSKMPTKDALLTKILSRRWKTLSPFRIFPIHLDLDQYSGFPTSASFANFVDYLFDEELQNVPSLESVFLRWTDFKDREEHVDDDSDFEDFEPEDIDIDEDVDEKIVAWIRETVQLQVVRLELMKELNLPFRLILNTLDNCATLVELRLSAMDRSFYKEETFFSFPKKFHLPNLKKLHLHFVYTDSSINAVIAGCPMLNELSFNECIFYDRVHINSPLLKFLAITDVGFPKGVRIDAPNVEVLVFSGNEKTGKYWIGAKFKSLHSAYVKLSITENRADEYDLHQLAKSVKVCSNATRLCLSVDDVENLGIGFDRPFPFPNVTWMAFDAKDCDVLGVIGFFLYNMPIVQTLLFEDVSNTYNGGYESFIFALPTVPVCLEQSLKKIEFLSFNFEEDEMKLVEYFLKNGRVLEEVTLQYDYDYCNDTSIEINRLLTYPKKSKSCQILIKKAKGSLHRSLLKDSLLKECLSFTNYYDKLSFWSKN